MPKITLTALGSGEIPANVKRKALIFTLISGDAYHGWQNVISAAGDADAGIPMAVGAPVSMAAATYDFSKRLALYSTGGGVINWQENVG